MPGVVFAFGYQAMLRRFGAWRDYLRKATRSPETRKIAIEFCTEVAVLLAVFPWLETVIAGRAAYNVARPVATPSNNWFVAETLAVAAIFFVLAVIMAVGRGE